MIITLYDFNSLDEIEKGAALFPDGTFIDDRDEDVFKVQLYRLNTFYVEVYYDWKANEINRYRAFNSLGQLAPYMKK